MKDFCIFSTRNRLTEVEKCGAASISCRARIHTDAITGDVVKNLGDHNHDSNAAKIEVVRTVTAVKRRAVDTNEGTARVITIRSRTLHKLYKDNSRQDMQ